MRPAWGGNGNARRQRNNLDLRGNMGDVGDGLTEPDAATGSNHGQGSNGRRINDDDYQDVNITNIDPDSPSATGMWAEGVDYQKLPARLSPVSEARETRAALPAANHS